MVARQPDGARVHDRVVARGTASSADAWAKLAADREFGAAADAALQNISVIEAAHAEEELLAVSVSLRQAVNEGKTAALVTPDRALARRVRAALARWNIAAEDLSGEALATTPAGIFARLTAEVALGGLAPVPLLALLKHPLLRLRSDGRAVAALERAVLRGPRPRAGSTGGLRRRVVADFLIVEMVLAGGLVMRRGERVARRLGGARRDDIERFGALGWMPEIALADGLGRLRLGAAQRVRRRVMCHPLGAGLLIVMLVMLVGVGLVRRLLLIGRLVLVFAVLVITVIMVVVVLVPAVLARLRARFLAGVGGVFGFALGVERRLPVGNRDAVIVGVDLVESQEAMAVAAIFDKGRLE